MLYRTVQISPMTAPLDSTAATLFLLRTSSITKPLAVDRTRVLS